MKRISTCFAALVGLTIAREGQTTEHVCPSASDVSYAVQKGETLVTLGARAYCLDGEGARTRAALALYEYNRGRIGSESAGLPQGVTVCLPQFLHGSFFDAERCRSAPDSTNGIASTQAVSPPAPISAPNPVCGNGLREGAEVCDGADLAGVSCASLNLPMGKLTCRADCQSFDAHACVAKPPPPPPPPDGEGWKPDEPAKPISGSLNLEAAAGAQFPLSMPGTASLYGTLALLRVGSRVRIGRVEFVPHGVFGAGGGTTLLDGHDADLSVLAAGAGLQFGIPFVLNKSLHLTPGLEAQRLWIRRDVDARPPFGPAHVEQDGGISIFGAFLRPEVHFARFPRLAASVEIALGYVPGAQADFRVGHQFQVKTFAGVSYHAF